MSKRNESKYDPTLVYRSMIEAMARVREYGVKKHGGREDWRTTNRQFHRAAMMRHLLAYLEGELNDKESGLPHLAHAATNIMFLIEDGGDNVSSDVYTVCSKSGLIINDTKANNNTSINECSNVRPTRERTVFNSIFGYRRIDKK